jgi:hypothetical protein
MHARCHKFLKADRLRFSRMNNGASTTFAVACPDVTQGAKDAVLLGISAIAEISDSSAMLGSFRPAS